MNPGKRLTQYEMEADRMIADRLQDAKEDQERERQETANPTCDDCDLNPPLCDSCIGA